MSSTTDGTVVPIVEALDVFRALIFRKAKSSPNELIRKAASPLTIAAKYNGDVCTLHDEVVRHLKEAIKSDAERVLALSAVANSTN